MHDELKSQFDFTSAYEGIVPYLYKDSRGFVTCGVGHLCATREALNPLPWKPSLAAAQYDWRELANTGGVHAAEYYRQLTVARLEFASIVALFDHDMAIAESGIRTWLVERYALEVQIVLRDMVFNLGAARMSKYIKLRAALDRADYPMAADECHRNGVQSARNEACRKLILSCRT